MDLSPRSGQDRRTALEELARELAVCTRCPRLTRYRRATAQSGWRARPVPGWGDPAARLLLVGLAPSLRGANAHGRMFTGDASAATLTRALHSLGLASAPASTDANDGLCLRDVWMTAAARCAPPNNRPTAAELAQCRPWLERELTLIPWCSAVALGSVAWTALGAALELRLPRFAHGLCVRVGERALWASYHPSPQNTNTGKLTDAMLLEVLGRAHRFALSASASQP